MADLQTVRQFLYDIKKSLFPRRQKVVSAPVVNGLPPGLEMDTLRAVGQDYIGSPIQSVAHQHLSGWKTSGAYRLHLKNQAGKDFLLVYKEAVYGHDDIPALTDLPVCPGPPEYAVFSQPVGELARFLPRVFLAEELIPGKYYRYIVEDLSDSYHNATESQALLHATRMLPKLHLALNAWADQANTHNLIQYGIDFSRALQQYAHNNLSAYYRTVSTPELEKVLAQWPEITHLHTHPGFFTLQPTIPIHGDTNFTNIYVHDHNPEDIKLVDWEWAGFGSPFADLVSLLKSAPLLVEKRAISEFINRAARAQSGLLMGLSEKQYRQFYYWAQIERGILDSAFLSSQLVNGNREGNFSLSTAINRSLQRLLTAYQHLSV